MRFRCVTVWKRKKDGSFKRYLFERACVRRIKNDSVTGHFHDRADDVTVRIFTVSDIEIEPGDRLSVGYDEAVIPARDSFVVCEAVSNFDVERRVRHIKVKCR